MEPRLLTPLLWIATVSLALALTPGAEVVPATTSLWRLAGDPASQILLIAGRLLALLVCGATLVLVPFAVHFLALRTSLFAQTLMSSGTTTGLEETSLLLANLTYVALELALACQALATGLRWITRRPSPSGRSHFREWLLALVLLSICRIRDVSPVAMATIGVGTWIATFLSRLAERPLSRSREVEARTP